MLPPGLMCFNGAGALDTPIDYVVTDKLLAAWMWNMGSAARVWPPIGWSDGVVSDWRQDVEVAGAIPKVSVERTPGSRPPLSGGNGGCSCDRRRHSSGHLGGTVAQ